MKIIQFSTRRPVTVFIFAVAAVVFGVVAFRQLATDLLPDITYPSLTVETTYEGAAPAEIESLISRPVENSVGVVNNVVRVVSRSRAAAIPYTSKACSIRCFCSRTCMALDPTAGLEARSRPA